MNARQIWEEISAGKTVNIVIPTPKEAAALRSQLQTYKSRTNASFERIGMGSFTVGMEIKVIPIEPKEAGWIYSISLTKKNSSTKQYAIADITIVECFSQEGKT